MSDELNIYLKKNEQQISEDNLELKKTTDIDLMLKSDSLLKNFIRIVYIYNIIKKILIKFK